MAEVREWKRVRGGRLWGLVRWEPDPVAGEFPLDWLEENTAIVICTKSVATVTFEMPKPQKKLAIYPGASHIDALHCPSGIAIEVRGPKRRARTSLAHE